MPHTLRCYECPEVFTFEIEAQNQKHHWCKVVLGSTVSEYRAFLEILHALVNAKGPRSWFITSKNWVI